MKHATTRAVFEYWNQRRGARAAPERNDIDPGAIRHALGDTFMLAADFVDEVRFRLAGTRVCALFCREVKGEVFSDAFGDASRRAVDELVAIVDKEKSGVVAGLIARTEEGHRAELEMLLLPLASSGHARVRAIGVLAPLAPPYWLGIEAVTSLELVSLRHIDNGPEARPVPRFGRPGEGSRFRHRFIVYSGGRRTAPPGERTG
jgi:hypothetical protein